jgi:hypothetical protein
MTNLTHPVRRETAANYRGRALIVELHPAYLEIRLKGTRRRVTLDYPTALEVGYKILARQQESERAAEKKARKRKGRR